MKRQGLNLLVDTLAFACFVLVLVTGLVLRFVLPPGSGGQWALWGLGRHDWGGVHFWIAVVVLAIMVIHLILHWRWVVCMVVDHWREKTGFLVRLSVAGLIVLLIASTMLLLSPKEQLLPSVASGKENHVRHTAGVEEPSKRVRGDMTLAEVEASFGVPAEYLLEKLGLPEGTASSEKLGKLRHEYSFEMDAVNEIVAHYPGRSIGSSNAR